MRWMGREKYWRERDEKRKMKKERERDGDGGEKDGDGENEHKQASERAEQPACISKGGEKK